MKRIATFNHRMLFDIAYHHSATENVRVTDLCDQHDGWPSSDSISVRMRSLFYDDSPSVRVELDRDFYMRDKQLYDQCECCTWWKKGPPDYPQATCRLFLLKDTLTSNGAIAKLKHFARAG